jgi:H+/Cl- antiporter ClcA
LKFGGEATATDNTDVLILLPGALIIGVIGGLLGPLFINLNTRVNVYRKNLLSKNYIKVIETAFFGFATASIFFIFPKWFGYC